METTGIAGKDGGEVEDSDEVAKKRLLLETMEPVVLISMKEQPPMV